MKTFQEHFNHVLLKENQILWMVLALHAGYLNAGGFLACHRFVSHMTGFGTQIGVSFGLGEYLIAFEMMLAPVFFVAGAGCAGYLMDRKLVNNKKPRLFRGMGIIIVFDLIVLLGGVSGVFGDFGEPIVYQRDFILLFLLVFTCGLQNGLFVTLTSGQVRTTHLTGLATDLGLYAVRIFSVKDSKLKTELISKNFLRLKTMICFSTGSLFSALIFQRTGYWGFMVSFGFAVMIYCYMKVITRDIT